jgi:hypothetical protein
MRWAAPIGVAVVLASQPGCGLARSAAKSATEGVVGKLAGKVGDREQIKQLTEGVSRRSVGAAVSAIGQPEQLADVRRIAAELAAGTVSGASRALGLGLPGASEGMGELGTRARPGATPVEGFARQAAGGFARQMAAELGRAGDGALAESLAATTEQVAGAMARGARGELAPLFPECRGADSGRCLDQAIERVSRATAAGVVTGIREALGVWLLALAFGGGALLALALVWARGVYRGRGPAVAS